MNHILISLIGVSILITSASLLGQFFGLEMYVYMPYIVWLIGLCIFGIILEPIHENIFLKTQK